MPPECGRCHMRHDITLDCPRIRHQVRHTVRLLPDGSALCFTCFAGCPVDNTSSLVPSEWVMAHVISWLGKPTHERLVELAEFKQELAQI